MAADSRASSDAPPLLCMYGLCTASLIYPIILYWHQPQRGNPAPSRLNMYVPTDVRPGITSTSAHVAQDAARAKKRHHPGQVRRISPNAHAHKHPSGPQRAAASRLTLRGQATVRQRDDDDGASRATHATRETRFPRSPWSPWSENDGPRRNGNPCRHQANVLFSLLPLSSAESRVESRQLLTPTSACRTCQLQRPTCHAHSMSCDFTPGK